MARGRRSLGYSGPLAFQVLCYLSMELKSPNLQATRPPLFGRCLVPRPASLPELVLIGLPATNKDASHPAVLDLADLSGKYIIKLTISQPPLLYPSFGHCTS